MRGSIAQWLSVATIVMLAAVVALGITLAAGLASADRLLDRSGRSQAQLALAYRLEANGNALMAPDTGLRRGAATALDADLVRYHDSIVAETVELAPAARAAQTPEADRAAALSTLAVRMEGESGAALAQDAGHFRGLVRAIVTREDAEAAAALAEMRGLRRHATTLAVALPLGLALLAIWFFTAIRGGLVRPLARLRRAAATIGRGGVDAAGPGFSDFVPLADALAQADREIVRQRSALAEANRVLETQVAERTATLAERNERLAAIDATRRMFFSQVGHELRTPITVIRGEAEVVLRDAAADRARLREALDHIVVTGTVLGRRIDDLLAVARAEDGRLTVARHRLDLVAIVRAAGTIARPYAASAGVSLTLRLPDTALAVDGDASWLQQALLALIDNAVRHAASGGGRIILSVEEQDDAMTVTVADDGPGVPPALLPRLFEAWSQADGASGGSGLGMAVARWVADAHHGTIAAANLAAGGFAVTMRLPRA